MVFGIDNLPNTWMLEEGRYSVVFLYEYAYLKFVLICKFCKILSLRTTELKFYMYTTNNKINIFSEVYFNRMYIEKVVCTVRNLFLSYSIYSTALLPKIIKSNKYFPK